MNIMYKCSFCNKIYDWYEVVYENEKDENSIFVKANCFKLLYHAPLEIEKTDLQNADGNLNNLCINVCPDCMHKIIDNIKIDNNPAWDMV